MGGKIAGGRNSVSQFATCASTSPARGRLRPLKKAEMDQKKSGEPAQNPAGFLWWVREAKVITRLPEGRPTLL
jgi:hypothetical protein